MKNNELSSNDIVCFKDGNNITAGGYTIHSCFLKNNFLPFSKNKLDNEKFADLINELSVPAGLLSLQNNVMYNLTDKEDKQDDELDKIIDIHINNKNRKHSYNDFYFDNEDVNEIQENNIELKTNKVISSELYNKLLDIVDTVKKESKKEQETKQAKEKKQTRHNKYRKYKKKQTKKPKKNLKK